MWTLPKTSAQWAAWWRRRRHPLCPHCGFNLLGALAAKSPICPECGWPIVDEEIRFGWTKNDWTEKVGMRRAFVSLLWRGATCMTVWMGILLALSAIAPAVGWGGCFVDVVAAACLCGTGIVLGLLMGHRLSESVGVSGGGPLLIVTLATYWLALGVGTWAAGAYVSITAAAAYFAVGITGVIGSVVIARSLVLSN